LNYFICFSLGQLDYINKTWLEHYHPFRPHQGKDIGNNILDADFKPETEGTIKHREKPFKVADESESAYKSKSHFAIPEIGSASRSVS
jgi:hypothetical protein